MPRLPDFVIIGCMKGGTTALQYHLKQHPRIFMPEPKELHFFGKEWQRGIEWYKSFFPDAKDRRICGEATPVYIYLTQYHERMHDAIPDAKLILVVRDPVRRAFSQWNNQRDGWYAGRSFEDVVRHDLSQVNNPDHRPWYEDLVQRGFYIDQIENLLRFYDRQSLLVIISEKMKKDFHGEFEKVLDFLGMEKKRSYLEKVMRFLKRDSRVPVRDDVNKGKYTSAMAPETRNVLSEIYRPYNERFFRFLSHEIEEWKK